MDFDDLDGESTSCVLEKKFNAPIFESDMYSLCQINYYVSFYPKLCYFVKFSRVELIRDLNLTCSTIQSSVLRYLNSDENYKHFETIFVSKEGNINSVNVLLKITLLNLFIIVLFAVCSIGWLICHWKSRYGSNEAFDYHRQNQCEFINNVKIPVIVV